MEELQLQLQGKCFGEVLPYLEIKNEDETNKISEIAVPNIIGISIKDAENKIKELNLKLKIDDEEIDKENTIIKEQVPINGVKVNEGSKIIIKY